MVIILDFLKIRVRGRVVETDKIFCADEVLYAVGCLVVRQHLVSGSFLYPCRECL